MDEQLTISTPEQVAFQYELAGIGSRFVAALLDHLILGIALFLIICAYSAVGLASVVERSSAGFFVVALLVLVLFGVLWGYFVIFETVWNGQTPGKRAGRLRVIRRSGQPIGAGEAMVRNIIRFVDFLPAFYGIGLLTMFIDKEARRLGDFAANTIVIREGQETRLQDVRVSAPMPEAATVQTTYVQPQPQMPQHTGYVVENGRARPTYATYTPQPQMPESAPPVAAYTMPMPQRSDPLPGISIRDVTAEDYALIREMLARSYRGELSPQRSKELASRLARGVAARMGQDFVEWQMRGWEPLVFLQCVLEAHEIRG